MTNLEDSWLARGSAAVLLLSLGACETEGPQDVLPSNIVLITLDTTRADHLGYHGYERDTSPFMDAFAAESIIFDRCIVPMATTLPTHTSILTGTWPLEHGVLANASQGGRRFQTAPGLRSFAEHAQEAGYATGGFVSATPLKRDSGIAAGFDTYEQPEAMYSGGQRTTGHALEWLSRQGLDRPFFMWVHYFDAHWPTNSPAEYRTMFTIDDDLREWIGERDVAPIAERSLAGTREHTEVTINQYDMDLRYQDDQLRRIVEALRARGDWDRTAVVVIGDHGDGHGQHNHLAHGRTWNEQLHAPFLLRVPGELARHEERLASAADALPTLLGRLESSAFDGFLEQCSGRDVLSTNGAETRLLSQDTSRDAKGRDFRWALTSARWKYFRIDRANGAMREELYDLQEDPFELHDVSELHADVVAANRAHLERLLTEQRTRGETLRAGAALTKPAAEGIGAELESLGYTGTDDEED